MPRLGPDPTEWFGGINHRAFGERAQQAITRLLLLLTSLTAAGYLRRQVCLCAGDKTPLTILEKRGKGSCKGEVVNIQIRRTKGFLLFCTQMREGTENNRPCQNECSAVAAAHEAAASRLLLTHTRVSRLGLCGSCLWRESLSLSPSV